MQRLPDARCHKCVPGRLEERVSVARIGFEVCAFGPFVPGVDENKLPVGRIVGLRPVDETGEPLAVGLGGLEIDGGVGVGFAGGVVPGGEAAAEDRDVNLY